MTTKKSISNIFNSYTEESCYWAGFFAADASIDTNGTISFELNSKDRDAIVSLKNSLNSNHSITFRENTDAYRIRFNDKEITNSLLYNFNVSVNKTFSMFLPILPESMYPHFLRGHFDGDGCLTEFFANRPTASFRVYITSASLVFLEELKTFLVLRKVINTGSIQKKSANCWHLQLAIKDSIGFLNYIYCNNTAVYKLERKYIKYKTIVVDGIRRKR